MVHYFVTSIFLLPIGITLGGDFWNDVDKLHNELLGPHDSPTQTTTNNAQQVELTPETLRHSLSPHYMEENRCLKRRFLEKLVTLRSVEVETFKQTLIIDESYPQNISFEELEDKLLALGESHKWLDLSTYDMNTYAKYWAKVCVLFWGKPLVEKLNYACKVSSSYSSNTKRRIKTRNMTQNLDLLSCRCHMYKMNCRFALFPSETFLIHKGSENEYYIFQKNEPKKDRYNLSVKGFKGGITLPIPVDGLHGRSTKSKFVEKQVTLNPYNIQRFYEALTIDTSYPENISLPELEYKLKNFEEIHYWPNLHKYNVENYSKYWAKVCVVFWGKQLDRTHRQVCLLSPSYGINRKRKLFLPGRVLYLDLLCCKCHSYTTNYRNPVSAADTFLIHQSTENEYFVFEQYATERCNYTQKIKNFKGGIILPDPDIFNY